MLSGQRAGRGRPVAYFLDLSGAAGPPPVVNQVPFDFSFDLNTGSILLNGAFPNPTPRTLAFAVECISLVDMPGFGGTTILLRSALGQTSDTAGYVIAFLIQHQ